jgi:phosphatidylserine decarboxylase
MKIHKEGKIIIPAAFISITLMYLGLTWLISLPLFSWGLGIVAVTFWSLVISFFRVPKLNSPTGDDLVIAPAEGKIVVIEQTHEGEYLNEERIQISIFMSPLNVHVNRAPVGGKISYYKYHPGKYLVAWHPKSSSQNERTSIGFETPSGTTLLMRQIAGAVARRIAFYKKVSDNVCAADEVGFIRFGSRVDVFLPLNAEIKVKIGDMTVGGETILAHLKD